MLVIISELTPDYHEVIIKWLEDLVGSGGGIVERL